MAIIIRHPNQARLLGQARVPHSPGLVPRFVKRRCVSLKAAYKASNDEEQRPARDAHTRLTSVVQTYLRRLSAAVAGSVAWVSITGSALAAVDQGTNQVVGPSTDVLLGTGHEFSFGSLLLFTLLGYWFAKAVEYLSQHTPDGQDKGGKADNQQQQQQDSLTDMGHAPIRSYVDSSQPAPGSSADTRDLRNSSLARSAAYRVSATVRESQPRIHELVEQLAGPEGHWPLQPPRNTDVDFVASLVYDRVVQERMAKGPEAGSLCPRERAVLETRLLEEVAEKCAADQVAEFVDLAAKGKLNPRAPGSGGAGHPPPSHAH